MILPKKVAPSATKSAFKNFITILLVLTFVFRLKNIVTMKGVIKSSELIILNVTTTIALSVIQDGVYVFDVAKRLNYTNHG